MNPEPTSVILDGLTLRLQRWPGSNGTWLLLHEGLGSLDLWKGFPQQLHEATGHTVLAYERPGHGRSAPLPAPRTPAFLEEETTRLLHLMDHLGLERPWLLGHSDGGTLALMAAAACPQAIRGVLSLAAHVHVDPRTRDGLEAAHRAYHHQGLRAKLLPYHGDQTDALFEAWNTTWRAMPQWSMHASLPCITCPVVALQGAEDAYGEPGQLEAIRTGVSGPVSTHLIPACGHQPHREAPEAVLAAAQALIAMG